MMLLFTFSLSCLAATLSVVSAAPVNLRPRFNWDRTKYLYAFGDSYTFVGGTYGYPKFRYALTIRGLTKIPLTNEHARDIIVVSSAVPSTSRLPRRNF